MSNDCVLEDGAEQSGADCCDDGGFLILET